MKGSQFLAIYISLLLCSTNVFAQYFPGKVITKPGDIPPFIIALKHATQPRDRVQKLLKLGSLYLFKNGEEKNDLDSAFLLIGQAKALSLKINDKKGYNEAVLLTAGYYSESGNYVAARRQIKLVTDTNRLKMLFYLGDQYYYVANDFRPLKLIYVDTSKMLYQKALELSVSLNRKNDAIKAVDKLISNINEYDNQRRFDRVVQDYEYLITHIERTGHKTTKAKLRLNLALFYIYQGDYANALRVDLTALKEINNQTLDEDIGGIYGQIGHVYRLTDKYERSNEYYFKLLASPEKYIKGSLYPFINNICYNLRGLKQVDKSLELLLDFQKKHPPVSDEDKVALERALGQTYSSLNQLGLAEEHFLRAVQLSTKMKSGTSALYMYLGSIYARMGNYKKANEALARCEEQSKDQHAKFLNSLYALRSQVDSTLGDYRSALVYILKSKRISDSIYTVSKEKHTQELTIQYETQKKEAQIRQNEANIRILNQDNILQQQKVNLQQSQLDKAALLDLKNQAVLKLKERDLQLKSKDLRSVNQIASLQKTKLQQADLNKEITAAIIVLLLVIIVLIFRQFRQKQRSAKVVDEKNKQLNQLISEKDWLLKEVHHRVKNNLQIIISLLESQANYLDDVALAAIKTSQNRIYAMSLIHQKLYQSEQTKTINMEHYIPELIGYLGDSFENGKAIRYDLDIDPVKIDVSRAIPIGLILNEVVTNSLKYAFEGQIKGLITVKLKITGPNICSLLIADDGVGLSAVPSTHKPDSMGMKLIKGLSRELNGQLELNGNNGTQINIFNLLIDTASIETKGPSRKSAVL